MSEPGLLKFELVTEEPAVLVANTIYFVKNATVNRIVISGNLPQDPLRVTSTTALENIASKLYIASGNTKEEARNSIDAAPIAHVGSGGTSHAVVVAGGAAGFMSGADKSKLDAVSGSNTGDETTATIKSKLGITTLSGVNTGDQTTITGNAGSATRLETARTIGGVSFDGTANINLPGVNAPGNQNTSGTAERANGLNKTLNINGTSFNGVNDVNVSVGFLNIPLVSASANTLITKAHAGGGLKHPASDTTARTFTVDSNANQNWGDGTTIAIWNVNGTGGVITIAVNTDTMRLADDGTTGSRSLRRNGFAILVWDIESLSWIISGPGVS